MLLSKRKGITCGCCSYLELYGHQCERGCKGVGTWFRQARKHQLCVWALECARSALLLVPVHVNTGIRV